MTEQEKDEFIRKRLTQDKVISKNAENIFKKNYIMEENMENKRMGILKYKKVLAIVASLLIILGGANVYASTNGYGNIFFLVNYLITGNNETKENDEVLSDKDITISYENISIEGDITIRIEKFQIKDGKAKLIVKVDETKEQNENITPFIYKVFDENGNELASQNSSKSIQDELYTDEIIIDNYSKDTNILVLKIYTPIQELLKEIKINLENKTIEISRNTDELEKISEIELKEYLGQYVKLNSYDIFVSENGNITKEEWNNQEKVSVAMNLIYTNEEANGEYKAYDNIKFTQAKVKQAIKEFMGENNSGELKLPGDGWGFISYDESSKSYMNEPGDGGINGLCIAIKNIKYNNGIYEVTFTYCYPSEENYTLGNIDKLAVYETTMKFKLNSEYKYTKYCLVDFDKNEYKKIKESEIEELDYNLDDTDFTELNTTDDEITRLDLDSGNNTSISSSDNSNSQT